VSILTEKCQRCGLDVRQRTLTEHTVCDDPKHTVNKTVEMCTDCVIERARMKRARELISRYNSNSLTAEQKSKAVSELEVWVMSVPYEDDTDLEHDFIETFEAAIEILEPLGLI
jgi:hypothetical protein